MLGGGNGFALLPLLSIGGLAFFLFRAYRNRMPGLAGGPGPTPFGAFESALAALGRHARPEVFRNFERDLGENRAPAVHDDVADPRLLRGDLAELWTFRRDRGGAWLPSAIQQTR
ncbi:hypothetical protein D3272_01925 [Lichenibacterium ramalinae]|uniref:Uncharacterized protein n=2 Tax=Lichenibacterium ramalinae TaxID=2316527 RepID=A0A4Q2RKM4_9HYPH|nr:hypothetical protein D3272_01925 [Lichenibacterium ramalinae]